MESRLAGRLQDAFGRGPGAGLLRLGAGEAGRPLPPVFAWWRDFAGRYVAAICGRPESAASEPTPAAAAGDLGWLALTAPVMPGAEYVGPAALAALWEEMDRALSAERAASGRTVEEILRSYDPGWNVVGRVHFHLAENRRDPGAPFAFLATYAHRRSAAGAAQHLPLGNALKEYAGGSNREKLLSLLVPVQRAAESLPWLRTIVDSGEIFHPLRWSPAEALRFLSSAPELEAAGVVLRMPAAWANRRPPRPKVGAVVGGAPPAGLGGEELLDFRMEVSLDGEPLTPEEIEAILTGADGLVLVRGRWVEIDRARLGEMMERFRRFADLHAKGIGFAEATRLLAGAAPGGESDLPPVDPDFAEVVAGPWLAETLERLRSPAGTAELLPGRELRAALRPYQESGVRWLHQLASLRLGACLADDMGLGKTIQILALLLVRRRREPASGRPNLLVAPASLLANWTAEAERFAPSLRIVVAHGSAMPAAELAGDTPPAKAVQADLVITTYGSLQRIRWLAAGEWDLVVLDEAQAIKNPAARQTRAAKALKCRSRIALTGTPVENRLSDLWSIFDFLNPGLLGSAKEFSAYVKRLASAEENPWAPLRNLVRPYLLRRLKTDPLVIADLPEKTEVPAYCTLSPRQAVLYQKAVDELGERLASADGIERRGAVLSFLLRLKQILNHPSQWLGDGVYAEADSGKFRRLREIAEVVAEKQEKVLVFTQFQEIARPLATFLDGVFGRPGLSMTGATPVKARRELVRRFQEDEDAPFFVISLKVGGAGLNLTAASHVVHFDRWWNPAVENQATDRAFRIGQRRNVLVHKFVCRGTVEEKIEALLAAKAALARDLIEGGAELRLTELPDEELLRLVALDLGAIAEDGA